MTAQVNDSVFHQKVDYCLAGIDGAGLFNPKNHDLAPFSMFSCCWRGHVASYRIEEGNLRLTRLKLHVYPTERAAAKAGKGKALFGIKPVYAFLGAVSYSDLNEPIPFTRGLLIGHSFIKEFNFHMGFHSAWKYRNVRELIFENGHLIQEFDRSKDMENLREQLKQQPLTPGTSQEDKIKKWIENCFSRKYLRGL